MFYNNIPTLTFFNDADLEEIQDLATGLSEVEVLEYYALSEADLKDVETEDFKYFTIAFKRGRSIAKRRAVDHLFSAMRDRSGAQAAVVYLKHFGDKWPADSSDSDLGDGKFSFKVVLDS